MFLGIGGLIDKLSGSLAGNHDGIDRATGNRLNQVIVGVNKRSKAKCKNHPKAVSRNASPTLKPPHHNANWCILYNSNLLSDTYEQMCRK